MLEGVKDVLYLKCKISTEMEDYSECVQSTVTHANVLPEIALHHTGGIGSLV